MENRKGLILYKIGYVTRDGVTVTRENQKAFVHPINIAYEELSFDSKKSSSIVNLCECNFSEADLDNAIFGDISHTETTYIQNSNFRNATLQGAQISFCNFDGSDFSCASLKSADLSASDCKKVIFKNTNLSLACLLMTNARGANFSGANCDTSKLTYFTYDETTILSYDFRIKIALCNEIRLTQVLESITNEFILDGSYNRITGGGLIDCYLGRMDKEIASHIKRYGEISMNMSKKCDELLERVYDSLSEFSKCLIESAPKADIEEAYIFSFEPVLDNGGVLGYFR